MHITSWQGRETVRFGVDSRDQRSRSYTKPTIDLASGAEPTQGFWWRLRRCCCFCCRLSVLRVVEPGLYRSRLTDSSDCWLMRRLRRVKRRVSCRCLEVLRPSASSATTNSCNRSSKPSTPLSWERRCLNGEQLVIINDIVDNIQKIVYHCKYRPSCIFYHFQVIWRWRISRPWARLV